MFCPNFKNYLKTSPRRTWYIQTRNVQATPRSGEVTFDCPTPVHRMFRVRQKTSLFCLGWTEEGFRNACEAPRTPASVRRAFLTTQPLSCERGSCVALTARILAHTTADHQTRQVVGHPSCSARTPEQSGVDNIIGNIDTGRVGVGTNVTVFRLEARGTASRDTTPRITLCVK